MKTLHVTIAVSTIERLCSILADFGGEVTSITEAPRQALSHSVTLVSQQNRRKKQRRNRARAGKGPNGETLPSLVLDFFRQTPNVPVEAKNLVPFLRERGYRADASQALYRTMQKYPNGPITRVSHGLFRFHVPG